MTHKAGGGEERLPEEKEGGEERDLISRARIVALVFDRMANQGGEKSENKNGLHRRAW